MEDAEGTAEGPGKDKLAVAGNSAVSSNAMRTLKHPISNIFVAAQSKEPEMDAAQGFTDTCVASGGRHVAS